MELNCLLLSAPEGNIQRERTHVFKMGRKKEKIEGLTNFFTQVQSGKTEVSRDWLLSFTHNALLQRQPEAKQGRWKK